MKHTSSETDNPFYAEIMRDGMIIAPELPARPDTRNPYYERIRKEGVSVGRPTRDEGPRPATTVRSIRLPVTLWKKLEAQAKREKTTINAAIRQAAQLWIRV